MENESNIAKLIEDLQKGLNKSRKKTWPIWLLMCLGIGLYLVVVYKLIIIWLIGSKDPYSFSLVTLLICIISSMMCFWMKFLCNTLAETQNRDKIWQTKLTDAYGKLIENQVKLDNERVEQQSKKKQNNEK